MREPRGTGRDTSITSVTTAFLQEARDARPATPTMFVPLRPRAGSRRRARRVRSRYLAAAVASVNRSPGLLAAGHDDHRREPGSPQLERVVEPRRAAPATAGRRTAPRRARRSHRRPAPSLARCEPHLHERDPDVETATEASDRRRTRLAMRPGPTGTAEVDGCSGADGTTAVGAAISQTVVRGQHASARTSRSRRARTSDSNSGGPTVRPVTATRTGACALPELEAVALPHQSRARPSAPSASQSARSSYAVDRRRRAPSAAAGLHRLVPRRSSIGGSARNRKST